MIIINISDHCSDQHTQGTRRVANGQVPQQKYSMIHDQMSKLKLCYDRRSVSKSFLVWSTHLGLKTRFFFLSDSCVIVDVARHLWQEDGPVFYSEQYIDILHVMTWWYMQYIQGFCQFRLSTADYALSLLASAYEFW
jgi:hypothetical protein